MQTLTEHEQQAVVAFRQKLEQAFAGNFQSLLLFGSKARGDAHSDSDVDLLVVLSRVSWEDEKTVFGLVTEVFLDTGVVLSPKVFSADALEDKRRRNNVFVQEVDQDAVVL